MSSADVIISIKTIKDIEKITKNTKYINLSIDNVDMEVIDYFLLNGQKYSYSDIIDNKNGFTYVNYEIFKESEKIIDSIIDNMPTSLSDLEKIRYIYIKLGKLVNMDINALSDKNENIVLENINSVNNIWESLLNRKVTDVTLSKILMYLCSRIGIESELISNNINGHIANKISLGESFLIVDLANDIHNIQGKFSTKSFDKYNDNINIDKKVSYIKDNYMDYYIDQELKKIDYTSDNIIYEILVLTQNILSINNIGTVELSKIYKMIFDKYCPNYNININNLFINSNKNIKNHFIIISYNNKYYSFNYNKGNFITLDCNIILDSIKNNKIGLYNGEELNIKEKGLVL